MSQPFVGEIRMFAGNYAPQGWAFCDGQLLPVSENDALFSLFGTIYGGDGLTTFGLPDLRGRLPIHAGTGPGLSPRTLGAKAGAESVTLTVNELPGHTHPMEGAGRVGSSPNPGGSLPGTTTVFDPYISESPATALNTGVVTSVGGSQSHANVMPFLCVHFIVALFGVYPSRQ
jgi:microcystin-dependent protein